MTPTVPRVSVVTPSYNQAEYLERTIRSVLDQDYPDLEFIVIDGGSTDGSVDIIKRYADRLSYWVSEPDSGQVDALNKGLSRVTGDWVCWQNSDDLFYPGAFDELARSAAASPDAGLIIGNLMLVDEDDKPIRDVRYITPDHGALLAEGMLIANQAAFWRKSVQDQIGLLSNAYQCSFDYDWFLRLTAACRGVHVRRTWGALRIHSATKSATQVKQFAAENAQILAGREFPPWKRRLYMLRRLGLTLAQGDLSYVARGMVRRSGISDRMHD